MNPLSSFANTLPKLTFRPDHRLRLRLLATGGTAFFGAVLSASAAFAQAASPTGGIGAQANLFSSEIIDSGGTAANMAMYGAALVTFIFGVWSIWKSRQPQNREGGHMAMGMAGLVLCGLFATGPTWINKAAVSTSGGAATVNSTPAIVTFK